jgi:hypothetical protein
MQNALADSYAPLPSARPMDSRNALARLMFNEPQAMPVGGDLPARPARDVVTNRTPQVYDSQRLRDEARAELLDPSSTFNRYGAGFLGAATFGATGGGMLYHGSPRAGISRLNVSERGPFGRAVYMSPATTTARQYAGESGALYKASAPSEAFHGLGRSWMADGSSVNPYQVWRDQMARLVAAAPPQAQAQIAEMGARMDPSDGYPLFRRLSMLLGGDDAAQSLFQRAGFTGVSGIVDGPEVAIFRPVPVEPVR